ncbi:MAG: DUF1549 and DUF1553 domain-containing protein [Planctomycetota bacterium]|nr:DUF1549 and DUF1553 domain-containing protein [Planctomycetota bacterium]
MKISLHTFILLAGLTILAGATSAPIPLPSGKPEKVEAFPAMIELTTSRDWKAVVVQATWPDGLTHDVTDLAKLALEDKALAKIEGNKILPVLDGQTKLNVSYAGQTLSLPVRVARATADRPPSFRNDVVPVITGAGCNSGGCHGAAAGKDGFHLSLFGYDPQGDYQNVTRQLAGRRINTAMPEESLLLQKSTGAVQHTGGERFKADSANYAAVLRWLQAGAPNDPKDLPKVTAVQFMPAQMVMTAGTTQRFIVLATYSDGSQRDVTALATLTSNNDSAAAVEKPGLVAARERGEAFLFARFNVFSVAAQAIVVPPGLKYTWPETPENNYIDTLVNARLKKLRILPSELCGDVEFIRRATLDIVGLLPTPAELDAFLADTSPDKRTKLVDALLTRKEFVELWVMKFAELLQIRSDEGGANTGISYKSATLYYNWLAEQFGSNVPMDRIVRDLIASSGSNFTVPATNYYQVERETLKLTENAAQVFMGVQIQCAQCHNHPFDRWTMDDYYSFAAFFTQIGRKTGEDPRDTILFNSGSGDSKHPVGGHVMKPKFLGAPTPEIPGDRREALAKWLTAPENPFFSRNLANIVWAHFLGRGIVEPVDNVRVTNPPSNPELAAELGKRFAEYHYDFRKLVHDICTSRTYQLATRANATNNLDQRNFSHARVRRVRSEVLFDVISQVTDTAGANKFKGLPAGARAVQIADGRTTSYFLTTFGRAPRESVSSCEVKTEPTLSQALHLINGETIQNKIREGGLVKKLLDSGKTPRQVIETLYVRSLCRPPRPDEIEPLAASLKDVADPVPGLEDIFWALLNSTEFVFNH